MLKCGDFRFFTDNLYILKYNIFIYGNVSMIMMYHIILSYLMVKKIKYKVFLR